MTYLELMKVFSLSLSLFMFAGEVYAAGEVVPAGGVSSPANKAPPLDADLAVQSFIQYLDDPALLNGMTDSEFGKLSSVLQNFINGNLSGVQDTTLRALITSLTELMRDGGSLRRINYENRTILTNQLDLILRKCIFGASSESAYVDFIVQRSQMLDWIWVSSVHMSYAEARELLLVDGFSSWELKFDKPPIELVRQVLSHEKVLYDPRVERRFITEMGSVLAGAKTRTSAADLQKYNAAAIDKISKLEYRLKNSPLSFVQEPFAINNDRSEIAKRNARKTLKSARSIVHLLLKRTKQSYGSLIKTTVCNMLYGASL